MSGTLLLANEYTVFRVGLGTNRVVDTKESKDALKKAIDLGITFIDTASAYTGGKSEEVIGKTLTPYPKGVVIATKGGLHAPDFRIDARPETLKEQLENSLITLRLKTISLYFLHRIDPHVPLKESLLFLKRMQEEGKIAHIGLSEVTVEQIEEARKYIDVAAVENEYNLSERKHERVISYVEKAGIVFIPFFPLHFSLSHPLVTLPLQQKYNASMQQLAIAWLLKRSPVILPIPGSLNMLHLKENVTAAQIDLTQSDFMLLSQSSL